MKADEIRAALRARYSDARRYAVAEEVGITTGYSPRRLDMIVLDCYESNGFRIDGIEIKVSKADLKRELENPSKHVAFFDVIDYYTLACPAGVADMNVIPPKWGVLQVNEDGTTRYRRRPIALHDDKPQDVPRGFFASITRAIQGREPATAELEAEYKRGIRDEQNRQAREKKTMLDRLEREADKIKKYDELTYRLGLWGDEQESAIYRFEQIQSLGLAWLIPSLKRNIQSMQEIVSKLDKPEDGEQRF